LVGLAEAALVWLAEAALVWLAGGGSSLARGGSQRADAQCELQLESPVRIAQLVAEQFADLPHPVPDRLRVDV